MATRTDSASVSFAAFVYEDRPWPWAFLGRRRVRQDITLFRVGDSLLVDLPPPFSARLELTIPPDQFVDAVKCLVAP